MIEPTARSCYHKNMSAPIKSLIVANTFGTLGYLSTILQWLWAFIVVGYPLLSHNHLSALLPEPSAHSHSTSIDLGALSPIATITAIVFTFLVVGFTIVALIRMPMAIGKRGSKTTHKAATVLVPIVSHQKLTKKQKRTLTIRLTWWIKLCLIVAPLFALLFASTETGLNQAIIYTIGGFCAIVSLVYFAIQRALQSIFRLDATTMW